MPLQVTHGDKLIGSIISSDMPFQTYQAQSKFTRRSLYRHGDLEDGEPRKCHRPVDRFSTRGEVCFQTVCLLVRVGYNGEERDPESIISWLG
jgi:hypothetical protein